MIPTIIGIMTITFIVIQFAPGGPVEQVLAQLSGQGGSATDRLSGGGNDFAQGSQADAGGSGSSQYRGSAGLDPEFIADLEAQFGFDKPPLERYFQMLWNYARFDFGESYFRTGSKNHSYFKFTGDRTTSKTCEEDRRVKWL